MSTLTTTLHAAAPTFLPPPSTHVYGISRSAAIDSLSLSKRMPTEPDIWNSKQIRAGRAAISLFDVYDSLKRCSSEWGKRRAGDLRSKIDDVAASTGPEGYTNMIRVQMSLAETIEQARDSHSEQNWSPADQSQAEVMRDLLGRSFVQWDPTFLE